MTRAMVNGRPHPLPEGAVRLVDWLRADLGLTGTKLPCGRGQCGGCSVLLDGAAVPSCCVLAGALAGRDVVTVEGLAERDDPLLTAFVEHGATQCGFCTPGMLVAARSYLDRATAVDEASIRAALAGNVCRCTGYTQIVAAVRAVARAAGLPVDPAASAWETA